MNDELKTPILRLAIPVPLRRSFDYLPPRGSAVSSLSPGIRIRVPFGKKELTGVLLEVTDHSALPRSRLKPAIEILDQQAVLPTELLNLLLWASQYYQHPVGEVIAMALPGLLRKGGEIKARGVIRWRLTPSGRGLDSQSLARAPRQAALLQRLKPEPDGLQGSQLDDTEGAWRPVMARLVERGWVEKMEGPCMPEVASSPSSAPLALSQAQQHAVDTVAASFNQYRAFLLDGVTGSGKTEVYLQLIEQALRAGKQSLVLVPEIGLTPQLLSRFRARLTTPVAVMHSGLNDQERLCAWISAATGEAGVIIGTRSALFTPLKNPGLFIIDEEHDLSFKQQDGFRYSARDLMLKRAQQLSHPVVLGSATPALESLHNCQLDRFHRLHLPERAGQAQPPEFTLLDVRGQKMEHGLSAQLIHTMRTHLAEGNQVMLFINRRGFAPVLMCHECGWHARCDRCDAHMTVHRAAHRQRCHHCGSERPIPEACPECGHEELLHMGYGTERVEQALNELFPDDPVVRIDRDTTRRKGAMQTMLDAINKGEARILIGTQMLAKGHHFPNLTLVALLDADYGLFSADFRAAERLGQLIIQVAGRAGRAERRGEVVIQTHHPESPLLRSLLSQDYNRFARALLAEREMTRLPPYSHFVLLRAEAVDTQLPMQFLSEARTKAAALGVENLEIYGPMPAPMERRAGRSRAQLLLQANSRSVFQQNLAAWLLALENLNSGRKVRWSLDVDPLEMF